MPKRPSTFCPDWASPPGATIVDVLEERGITRDVFAKRMSQSRTEIDALLSGKRTISIGTARVLSNVLGPSPEFWLMRDYHYRESANRLHGTSQSWLSELPVKHMIRQGWIPQKPQDLVAACLRFFDTPTIAAWSNKYTTGQLATYRMSQAHAKNLAAVAAWLRRGEIEAEHINCAEWNPSTLKSSLGKLRSLTRQSDPQNFLPTLVKECAAAGVAVVLVRAPQGCPASGAAWFRSPSQAVIAPSFRFLSDDHFWFTVFHEIGHLILHSKTKLHLEGTGADPDQLEREANDFAANALVPPDMQPELLMLTSDSRDIQRFAKRVGVSPGIIVGQLQHHGILTHAQQNRLKRRYTWTVPTHEMP